VMMELIDYAIDRGIILKCSQLARKIE
jgi:hypothetical protein